jgi:hypothetical protein
MGRRAPGLAYRSTVSTPGWVYRSRARLMDAWSEVAADSEPPMEIPKETNEKSSPSSRMGLRMLSRSTSARISGRLSLQTGQPRGSA